MNSFEKLGKVILSKVGNTTLQAKAAELIEEYTKAVDKNIVIETLGANADKVLQFIEQKFPTAFSVEGIFDEAPTQAAIMPESKVELPTDSEVIEAIITENASINRNKARKKAKGTRSTDIETPQIYDIKECFEHYNPHISRDELDAWLFHDRQSVLWQYYQPIKTEPELIELGLLCWNGTKLEYAYLYYQGDIYQKLRRLDKGLSGEPDADYITENYGSHVLQRQRDMLYQLRPDRKTLDSSVEDDLIIMHPFHHICRTTMIGEVNVDGRTITFSETAKVDGKTNVFQDLQTVFSEYVKSNHVKIDNKHWVDDYYIWGKGVRFSKQEKEQLTDEQQKEQASVRKEWAYTEGQKLFKKFLSVNLTENDRKALEGKWNEVYNSVVNEDKFRKMTDPTLTKSKIPVVFSFSKLFKNNRPLELSDVQRNGIGFFQEKGSAILGYDVGVGKTLTALACIANAFETGTAKRALLVVPDATYKKWIYEIQGGEEKDSSGKTLLKDGKPVMLKGALPHYPLFPFGNLSLDTIQNEVKEYSKQDKAFIEYISSFIEKGAELLKNLKLHQDKDSRKATIEFVKAYKNHILHKETQMGGVEEFLHDDISQRIRLLQMGSKAKDLVNQKGLSDIEKEIEYFEAFLNILKDELGIAILGRGEVRELPEKSIVLLNFHGLKNLGLNNESKNALFEKVYGILRQNGEGEDKETTVETQLSLQKQIDKAFGGRMLETKLLIEDFGIDFFCLDEAHNAKKLFTKIVGGVERMGKKVVTRYAINSGEPSDMAIQTFLISMYVQHRYKRNILLLTATPFTNSPLEVFSMLAIANHSYLEQQGRANIQDFFNTFVREEQQITINANGMPEVKPVLAGFYNLAQLKMMVFDIIDYQTGEDAKVSRPNKIVMGKNTTLATLEGTRVLSESNAIVKMTEKQKEITDRLRLYMESDGDEDSILNVCRDAFSLSPDVCSYTQVYLDNVLKLSAKYQGNYKENQAVKILRGLMMGKLTALSPYLYRCNTDPCPTAEAFVEESPKILYVVKCIETIKKWHESRGEEMSGQVIYMPTGIDYIHLVRDYLINRSGFAKHEVELIISQTSRNKREVIKEDFLRGRVKVVLGSSSIREGIDLQVRTTVLYNLVPDWNPTDYTQLEGRVWRQGNIHAYCMIVNVMAADSADIFVYQKLQEKTQRIKELLDKENRISQLNLESYDPEQMKEALIRNPMIRADLQIRREQKEITKLLDSYAIQRTRLSDLLREKDVFLRTHANFIEKLNALSVALATWQKRTDLEKDEAKRLVFEEQFEEEITAGTVTYKSKFNPEKEEYTPVVFDPNNLERGYLTKISNRASYLVRTAKENNQAPEFRGTINIYQTDGLQSTWRDMKNKYVDNVEELEKKGISITDLGRSTEEIIQKELSAKAELTKLQESYNDRVEKIISEQQNDLAMEKTAEERIEEVKHLFEYFAHKISEKKIDVIVESNQVSEPSEPEPVQTTGSQKEILLAELDLIEMLLEDGTNPVLEAEKELILMILE